MSGVFFVNPFHCLEVQDQFEEQWVVEYMSMSDEELTQTFYAASLVQSA